MNSVRDGDRTLQFNGELIASSSSQRRGANRWIEFELHVTESGSYILSRVGVSLIFHGAVCALVSRYSLEERPVSTLSSQAVPCEECAPELDLGIVFPEKYRHWAQVSDRPEAVVEALHKYDDNGARYLTGVAQRLLKDASRVDSGIARVYNVEIVP